MLRYINKFIIIIIIIIIKCQRYIPENWIDELQNIFHLGWHTAKAISPWLTYCESYFTLIDILWKLFHLGWHTVKAISPWLTYCKSYFTLVDELWNLLGWETVKLIWCRLMNCENSLTLVDDMWNICLLGWCTVKLIYLHWTVKSVSRAYVLYILNLSQYSWNTFIYVCIRVMNDKKWTKCANNCEDKLLIIPIFVTE